MKSITRDITGKPTGEFSDRYFCSSTACRQRFSATLQSAGGPPFQSKKSGLPQRATLFPIDHKAWSTYQLSTPFAAIA